MLQCVLACLVSAQNPDTSVLQKYEDTLITLRLQMIKSSDDKQRIAVNEQFIGMLDEAMAVKGFYEYPFSKVKTFGVISSPDKSFRLITWNLPYDDGSSFYYCYLQHYNKKKKALQTFELHDKSADISSPFVKSLDQFNWYGALYYSIIPFKRNGKRLYVVLGWDGISENITAKIIDVLWFTASGKPKFGVSVFKMEKKTRKRVLFRYSSQAVMTLRYEEKNKRIVFDHLSPSEPKYKDKFEYYGPDLSYDALQLKRGKWQYVPDIDARNPK